jgi:hypothetical protein
MRLRACGACGEWTVRATTIDGEHVIATVRSHPHGNIKLTESGAITVAEVYDIERPGWYRLHVLDCPESADERLQ